VQAVSMGIALLLAVAVWGQTPGSVTVEGEGVPVRQVLDSLFQQAGLQYVLDPAVQGDVTVKVKDVPFETALRLVLRAAHAHVQRGGRVYVIGPRARRAPP
jgi:Secretin and TonB N terminus short domain.